MQIFCLTLSAILVAMPGLYAQEMNHPRITSYASATLRVSGTTSRVDDSNYLKPEFVNNITVSAVRDFIRRFSEQPNARWYKMRDASLMVKFEAPDISYRVAYTSRGNWI